MGILNVSSSLGAIFYTYERVSAGDCPDAALCVLHVSLDQFTVDGDYGSFLFYELLDADSSSFILK